jgi:hypothetical protein
MPLNHNAARKLALLPYDEPLVKVTGRAQAPRRPMSTGSASPTGATDAPTPSWSRDRSLSGSTRSSPAGCCSPLTEFAGVACSSCSRPVSG